jgi:hypothetical protein
LLRRELGVALPPNRARHLFTPAGERLWADGWDPHFPAGESGDGAAVGTVFVTQAHEATTLWVVVESTENTVRYVRVTPGGLAGLVEVTLRADGSGGTIATVGYELTALVPEANEELARFTAAYDEFIAGWERDIASVVAAGRAH